MSRKQGKRGERHLQEDLAFYPCQKERLECRRSSVYFSMPFCQTKRSSSIGNQSKIIICQPLLAYFLPVHDILASFVYSLYFVFTLLPSFRVPFCVLISAHIVFFFIFFVLIHSDPTFILLGQSPLCLLRAYLFLEDIKMRSIQPSIPFPCFAIFFFFVSYPVRHAFFHLSPLSSLLSLSLSFSLSHFVSYHRSIIFFSFIPLCPTF